MKKTMFFLLFFLSFSFSVVSQPVSPALDNIFRFSFFYPEDDDLWEESSGFEYICRFWIDEFYALGLVFGFTSWDMNTVLAREIKSLYSPYYFDGEANFFSIGPSFSMKGKLSPNFSLSLDGSIQYVLANTDVDRSYYDPYYDSYYYDYYSYGDIDINDAVIGRLNFNAEMWVNNNFAMFTTIGYQFDISKGEITIDEPSVFIEIDDSSLEATSFSFGFIFSF